MTKQELRAELIGGKCLDDLFRFRLGQDCLMFKSSYFVADDHIRYIPDIDLNNIPVDDVLKHEDIDDVLSMCYTGNDFVEECGGDKELAERLFEYVDWQHPSSAIDEVQDEEDAAVVIHLERDRTEFLLVTVVNWIRAQIGDFTTAGNLYSLGFTAQELTNLGFGTLMVADIAANHEEDLPWI